MTAQAGRLILIQIDIATVYTSIGGIRSKSVNLNDSVVDITDSYSTGRWRELLEAAGIRSASMSGGGVFKDSAAENALKTHVLAGTHPNLKFIIPDFMTITGKFACPSVNFGAGHEGALEFNASFESNGELTFT